MSFVEGKQTRSDETRGTDRGNNALGAPSEYLDSCFAFFYQEGRDLISYPNFSIFPPEVNLEINFFLRLKPAIDCP